MAGPESRDGTDVSRRGSPTRKAAVMLVAVPALVLPALANICLLYLAPLIVAQFAGRLAGGAESSAATVLPYVLGFIRRRQALVDQRRPPSRECPVTLPTA